MMHVRFTHISANPDILSHPSLIELFSRGTNFRRAFLSHLSVEGAIEKCLRTFVNKQEEQLLGVQGILCEWEANVLVFVQKGTCCVSMFQSSSQSSISVPSDYLDHSEFSTFFC
jgi:hypothetical protein